MTPIRTRGEQYVDRGDPEAADFTEDALTEDGTWRDLDLSAIVPAAAAGHPVHIILSVTDDVPGTYAALRERGNANAVNMLACGVHTANVQNDETSFVMLDAARTIQYWASNVVWPLNGLLITVRGWFVGIRQ